MRKMKKVFAVVLAIMLFATLSTTAFAADKTLTENHITDTALVYYQAGKVDNKGNDDPTDDVVSGTYTVTIPEYIKAAKVGETPETSNITAKDVLIPYGTNLTVAVTFENALALSDNASTKIAYNMQANGTKIVSGDTILTVAAGDPNGTSTVPVGAVLTQAPIFAGAYTDTATFSVTVA